MYRLGKRKQRSKKPIIFSSILLVLVVLIGGGYAFVRYASKNSTKIANSAASVRFVNAGLTQKTHFDEGAFSLDLPPAWKLVSHTTPPVAAFNAYTFQGTTATESSRDVVVYEDTIPTNLAVNHELSVQPQGGAMSHGTVSDNCVNFVSAASRSTDQAMKQMVTPARWDGVDFLCDLGNYNRDVTGTSAAGTINKVALSDSQSGAHSFFFVYTDNNIEPDYTVLYNLLDSFKLK